MKGSFFPSPLQIEGGREGVTYLLPGTHGGDEVIRVAAERYNSKSDDL